MKFWISLPTRRMVVMANLSDNRKNFGLPTQPAEPQSRTRLTEQMIRRSKREGLLGMGSVRPLGCPC